MAKITVIPGIVQQFEVATEEDAKTLFTSLEGLYGEIRQLNDELHQMSDTIGHLRNELYNLTNRVDNCCGIDE